MRSQVPSSSHALSLLQQVEGDPYSRGTSSQRHPVCSTYRTPFRVLRSSALGRPRFFRGGSKGSRRSHCSSVSSVVLMSASIKVPTFLKWLLGLSPLRHLNFSFLFKETLNRTAASSPASSG